MIKIVLFNIWIVLFFTAIMVECYTTNRLVAYAKANLNVSEEVIHELSNPNIFNISNPKITTNDAAFHILFQVSRLSYIMAAILVGPLIVCFLVCICIIMFCIWLMTVVLYNSWFWELVFVSSLVALCLNECTECIEPVEPIVMQCTVIIV